MQGSALQFVAPALTADWSVVRAAVTTDGLSLAFADAELRDEPEIVLLAVSQNGFALEFASAARRADKVVVVAAVKQEGQALLFASDDLKNDGDVVEAAVGENYRALKFAASKLASVSNIVEAARASMEAQRADVTDVVAVETLITKMRRLSLQGHSARRLSLEQAFRSSLRLKDRESIKELQGEVAETASCNSSRATSEAGSRRGSVGVERVGAADATAWDGTLHAGSFSFMYRYI